jgi:alkylation response protein AidB-like acyl-CoA dehydrogenase
MVATADPSAGWAVMIGSGPNWFAGRMPDALAREMFAPAASCVAGAAAPGSALPVEGGWRIRGSWRWCSGAPWATFFTLTVQDGDGEFVVVVPASQVRLESDSWRSRGLAATASLTATVEELFVPTGRTFRLDAAPVRPEPIYRVPFDAFAEITMAAVAIGAMHGLLAEFRELARRKMPALAREALAAQPPVQWVVAEALGRLLAAEAAWRQTTHALWDAVGTNRDAPIEPRLRLEQRLAALGAVRCAAETAEQLRPWLGMDALVETAPVSRLVADALAIGQNAVVSVARLAAAGRDWLLEEAGRGPSALP